MRPLRLALVIASFGGMSCHPLRFGVDQSAKVIEAAMPAFYAEPDIAFARESAAANIKLVEGLLLTSPNNLSLLVQAAQGLSGYAFLFLESDLEAFPPGDERRAPIAARAGGFYRRGQAYALRYLAVRHPRFPQALDGSTAELEALVERVQRDEVPGLFWLAFAMAGYLNLNRDDVAAIADLGRIELLLRRVIDLDGRYFHAGAHVALGALESARPRAFGGNPLKGRDEIERAIRLTGGKFLLHKVMLARVYAVSVGDRGLYERTLREVVATPASVMPEQRLANEIARRRAERYLSLVDEMF